MTPSNRSDDGHSWARGSSSVDSRGFERLIVQAQIVIETAHPEFSEWRWIPADEVVDRIVPFKRAVYAQVMAAFTDRLCG